MSNRAAKPDDRMAVGRWGAGASADAAVGRRWVRRLTIGMLLLVALLPAVAVAETPGALPRLVRASRTDTPASLAERYLGDGARGWMISDYNAASSFADGQAVLIPSAVHRPGGLFPDGYQNVPVLAYGDIDKASEAEGTITPGRFEAQMRRLKKEGFVTITPDQLAAFMDFSGGLPEKAVLITFDVPSPALHDVVLPVLKALALQATVFVAVDDVGRDDALSWSQLTALQAAGFTIGCRGPDMPSLPASVGGTASKAPFEALATAMGQARRSIEQRMQQPCTALAWPQGKASDLLSAMAAKIGFTTAFTRLAGQTPFFGDRFAIPRIVVDAAVTDTALVDRLDTKIKLDLH